MPDADQPNVLWLCADQLRFDALGAYGNDVVSTPNIDALAASGVRFERAYCQSPVCTPSRASFLTGRYPRTTGCRQNGQPIPRDETLVTARLADAGYRCGLVGKLHLAPTNPDDQTAASGREPARRIDDGYGTVHWSGAPGDDHPANEYRQWLQSREATFDPQPYQESSYIETSVPPPDHHTTWCTDRAIDYVRNAAGEAYPWLLSVNYYDPHHPFDPPAEYLERYLGRLDAIEPPNYADGELDEKPRVQGEAAATGRFPGREMTAENHRHVRAAYYAMIDLLDDQIGRLLETLDETGQLTETLVVFQADHGEMLGDHGIYKKGPYCYEPAVRVPLILAQPGVVNEGVVDDALVELVDLAPTLVDAAGRPVPEAMQGRSLWPRLTGTVDGPHREDVYCEFYNASVRHQDPPVYVTMLRTDRYKLVAHHGTDDGELYDLSEASIERRNHWDAPSLVDEKTRLLERLTDRMAWTVDPLPERAGNW